MPFPQLMDCNFTMRGVKSLAYDLVVPPGRVNNRVVLLLRFIERQPARPRFLQREHTLSPTDRPASRGRFEGASRSYKEHL